MDETLLTKPLETIDLLDPETHVGQPWPLYERLRAEAPMHWDPIQELWWVSSYDGIVECARQPEVFTSVEGNVPKMPADPSFINLDGKKHRDRRKLISAFFKPSAVRRMERHIRDVIDELIDEVIEDGSCDLIEAIAAPLPARLIGDMTGIPREYHEDVRRWMDIFGQGGSGPDHVTMEVNEAFINFGGLHMMLVDERRVEPKDDLLSIWVNAEIDGEKMDEDDLLFEHTMMMFGGSETSRNALSGALYALSSRPDQRALLVEDPSLCGNAAEEATRWVSPFMRMSRTATRDAPLAGAEVKKGQEIVMFYPSANRDPSKFEDPYRFDVRRDFSKNRSLAFGYGHHYCLGAFLALAEVKHALQALNERMPDWQVAGEPTWVHSSFIRGLSSLPIAFTPGARKR